MSRWHDISAVALDGCYKSSMPDGLDESAHHVESLLKIEQALGIPQKRIMVAGFSQV